MIRTSLLLFLTLLSLVGVETTVSNSRDKMRDSFLSLDASNWDVVVGQGDTIRSDGNAAGASYLVISKNPFRAGTETTLLSKTIFTFPSRIAAGITQSQRVWGMESAFELVGVDGTGQPLTCTLPASVSLNGTTGILVNTLIWTIPTITNHPFNVGDRITLSGLSDSRLNVGPVTVLTIPSPTSFTITVPAMGNATYTFTGGQAAITCPTGGSLQNVGMLFDSATSGNIYAVNRNGCGSPQYTAWNPANSNTDAVVPAAPIAYAAPYTYALQPKENFEIYATMDHLAWALFDMDGTGTCRSSTKRTQSIPDINLSYKVRLRLRSLPNWSTPGPRIISSTKSGSTTATIVFDSPHAYTTGDQITVWGNRDATNFANLTTPTAVASVVNSTSITAVYGGSYTGSTYGGFAYKANGNGSQGSSLPAFGGNTVAIQTINKTTAGRLTCTSVNNWSNFAIGDTLWLYGLVDSTGTVLSLYEGRYRCALMSTTTLELDPLDGQPVAAIAGAITCGGQAMRCTDLRLHFLRALDYTRLVVEAYAGQSKNDAASSMPVTIQGWNGTQSVAQSGTWNMTQTGTWTVQPGNTPNTAPWLVSSGAAVGAAPTQSPLYIAGIDYGGKTRSPLLDVFGGIVGPGEVVTNFSLGTGAAAVTDGTNGKTIAVPPVEGVFYVGITTISTSPTLQIEGSNDNALWSIIPVSRIETTAASLQYAGAASWTPAIGQLYKGSSHGYNLLRLHLTGGTSTTTTGNFRYVPVPNDPGGLISPFSLTATNTTESVGVANGQISTGGVRTISVTGKASCKAVVCVEAMTGVLTWALEGTMDQGTTWVALPMQPTIGGPTVTSVVSAGTAAIPQCGIWETDAASYQRIRVHCTAWTAGTCYGYLRLLPLGANDGMGNSGKPTYCVTVTGITPTASTNIAVIESSATKCVIIKRIVVQPGTATANGFATLTLNRNTVAATAAGTTPTSATLQRDPSDPAFSGVVRTGAFTVTGVTTTASQVVLVIPTPISTTTTLAAPIVFDLTNGGTCKGFKIPYGTTNGVMLTHSGLVGASGFSCTPEWTEE